MCVPAIGFMFIHTHTQHASDDLSAFDTNANFDNLHKIIIDAFKAVYVVDKAVVINKSM